MRERCAKYRNNADKDSAQKIGRGKGRRARVRKKWRTAVWCLGQVKTQEMQLTCLTYFGAKVAKAKSGEGWGFLQMVRWGFTAWAWWVQWNKIQRLR